MRLAHRALNPRFLIRTALLLVALGAAHALAAPTVALHPLLVIGGEGDETNPYASLLDAALTKHGVHPVHPDKVHRFLAQPSTSRCQDDACLGNLARAASADRALLVSISPYTPRLIVSARLVTASGMEVASVAGRDYLKGGHPLAQVIREALDDFLGRFPFDAPDPKVPVAVKPPQAPAQTQPALLATQGSASSAPNVVATPVLAPEHAPTGAPVPALTDAAAPVAPHTTLRLASYLTAGAGALALIGATTVSLASRSDRARLEQMLDGSGNRPPSAEAQNLDQSLASRSRLTNLLLIGGGAALASGAAMFWLSRPTQAPTLAIVAGPEGAAASIQGQF